MIYLNFWRSKLPKGKVEKSLFDNSVSAMLFSELTIELIDACRRRAVNIQTLGIYNDIEEVLQLIDENQKKLENETLKENREIISCELRTFYTKLEMCFKIAEKYHIEVSSNLKNVIKQNLEIYSKECSETEL